MSFNLSEELKGMFADSEAPEGAAPVETPVTEGQAATTTETVDTPEQPIQPIDPSILKHGARIGELLVVDPNKGVDLTQFESGRRMQTKISELDNKIKELTKSKAEQTAAEEIAKKKSELQMRLAKSATEKERMTALVEYKDWEKGRLQAELDSIKKEQEISVERQGELEVVQDWDAYYSEEGYDPTFIKAVSERAWVMSNGDIPTYQNLRQTVIADVTARAARGLIKSPFVESAVKTGAQAPETPQTPNAVTPNSQNPGTPNLMDMFLNNDLGQLKSAIGIRR